MRHDAVNQSLLFLLLLLSVCSFKVQTYNHTLFYSAYTTWLRLHSYLAPRTFRKFRQTPTSETLISFALCYAGLVLAAYKSMRTDNGAKVSKLCFEGMSQVQAHGNGNHNNGNNNNELMKECTQRKIMKSR